MDNFDRDLEDLLNMTDSDDDDSSSSNEGVFESHHPLVLELHNLKKDEPGAEVVAQSQETKRKKKGKRQERRSEEDANKNEPNDTESDLSGSNPSVFDEATKEEFYDAHESYHTLPENQQASPTAALILAQVHSEHIHEPKVVLDRTTSPHITSTTSREPSTINKPVSNPP